MPLIFQLDYMKNIFTLESQDANMEVVNEALKQASALIDTYLEKHKKDDFDLGFLDT